MAITDDYKNLLADIAARDNPDTSNLSQSNIPNSQDPAALIAQTQQLAQQAGQEKAAQATQMAGQRAPASLSDDSSDDTDDTEDSDQDDEDSDNDQESSPQPGSSSTSSPKDPAALIAQTKQLAAKAGQEKADQATQMAQGNTNPMQGFGAGASQSDLSDAINKQQDLQKQAFLIKALSGFGDAAMLGTFQKPVDHTAQFAALDQMANMPTAKVAALRQGAMQNQQIMAEQAKNSATSDELSQNDPTSEISKAAQDFAVSKLGLPADKIQNVSYKNLHGLIEDARLKQQLEEQVAGRLEAAKMRAAYMNMALGVKQDAKATLQPKQLETISNFDDTLANAQQLKAMLQANPNLKNSLGPGDMGDSSIARSMRPDDVTAFRQLVEGTTSNYVKALGGARALNPSISTNLQAQTPQMTDTPKNFSQNLDTFIQKAQAQRDRHLQLLKASGKDVSNFLSPTSNIFPKTVINNQTGHQATVSNEQELAEAKASGFN